MKDNITKKMLHIIREAKINNETENSKPEVPVLKEHEEKMSFISEMEYLMSRNEKKKLIREEVEEEADEKEFVINKTDNQFGDLRNTQEETLKKTIGEMIEMGEKALVFYPKDKDLVLSAKIKSLNIAFQFRSNDPSGNGVYLWSNGLQLTDNNLRVVGKIGDAYKNWKQTLLQSGDLMDKLYKAATKD